MIPSNDFSFYDEVLDTSVIVGAIPEVYGWKGESVPLSTYFAMARGSDDDVETHAFGHDHGTDEHAHGVPAQEMTKWFDTNYHYMVPEVSRTQKFRLTALKAVDEYREAKALGFETRPVLLEPVTFLKLAKSKEVDFDPIGLIGSLVPVYVDILRHLSASGAEWVQMDEPCLALDLDNEAQDALRLAYATFARALPKLKIMLTSYFGGFGDNLDTVLSLPVAGLHLDLIRAPGQIDTVLARAPLGRVLSLGVIDGRNIWRADLSKILDRVEPVEARRGADRV